MDLFRCPKGIAAAALACLLAAGCSAPGGPDASTAPQTRPAPASPVISATPSPAVSPPLPAGSPTARPTPEATPWLGAPASPAPSPAPKPGREYYVVEQNQRMGVVDGLGRVILKPEFTKVTVFQNASGDGKDSAAFFAQQVVVRVGQEKYEFPGRLYGADGRLISRQTYVSVRGIGQGLLAVSETNHYEDVGVVTFGGKLVVPLQYTDVAAFGDVLAAVRLVGPEGSAGYQLDFYSRAGKLLGSMPVQCNDYIYGMGDRLPMWGTNGKMGLIGPDLKWAAQPEWEYIIYEGSDRYFMTGRDYKQGVIDKDGRVIVPCVYDSVQISADAQHPGHFVFSASGPGGVYLYDDLGAVRYHSTEYSFMTYTEGVLVVSDDADRLAIDAEGRALLPGVADVTCWLPESRLFECHDDKTNVVSYYAADGGKLPLPSDSDIYCLKADRFIVHAGGAGAGICDAGGNWIVRPSGRKLYQSNVDGILMCEETGSDGRTHYGLFDYDGNMLLPPEFDSLTSTYGMRLFYAKVGAVSGLIDAKGNWVWYTTDYSRLMD